MKHFYINAKIDINGYYRMAFIITSPQVQDEKERKDGQIDNTFTLLL